MGREYFGDIEGKFAFGIQNSNDIENLVNIDYLEQLCYFVCGCIYNEEEGSKYCKDCYESYEEHLDAAHEEECLEDDENILFHEDNVIIYIIKKDVHYTEFKNSMKNIKNLLPELVIEKFEEIKDNKDIINGYSEIFKPVVEEMDKYVEHRSIYFHRYKLGMQINYILNRQDTCSIYCEVY